jgi:tetratricopeptide (TPR) repeat protein
VLEDQRNFDQALPLFLKALEYGDIYFYYSRLGRIYSFLHLYDQSVAAYTKAIQIGPVGYRTLLGRSYSLDQVGRRAEALKDVNLGLTLFPDDKNLLERRDFYNNSGLIAIQQHSYSMIKSGSCTEALKEIDQGLTQFPDDKYLLELRGYCSKGTITGFTPWMSGSDYQKEFEDQVQLNRYPSKVEGKNESGYNQFRALFVPFLPGSFYFYSYYGMNRSSYEERMEDLTSKGFRLESSQTFIDSIGTLRYQATWIKK